MSKRRFYIFFIASIAVVISVIYFCNRRIIDASGNRLYSDVESIPYNKVGLLLGTSKYLSGNRLNPYYVYRIEAAVKLIKANKIKYVIVSGDNSTRNYDEPTTMRADLIHAGIDSTIIYLDYAGFRTFDSIIRAKEIFGQDSITIISQPFHNERAIFIAEKQRMSAIGFNARDVNKRAAFKVQFREKLARVKVFIDYIFRKKPKFLGPQVTIPS